MAFPKNDIEAIKSKLQLSTEIEKKTKIVKKGKDYWCCCLFHEEKTPSCKINDELGSFYCFGCGAKGDIFTIYTDLYNYTFTDAIKELAQRTGVNINFEESIPSKDQNNFFKILEIATIWFEDNINNNIDESKKYLLSRNISEDTIKFFRLGYSFNPEINLYKFLKDHSFNDDELIRSNIIKIDKHNKIRDYFYKRLIFPIKNQQGNIIGFGGRVLNDSNPKYINSPESVFFKKRNLLYNLDSAKKSARQKKNLLLCEGYMDVIALHEAGIHSAVAPLGTSLTEEQLILSWRFVDKPTIMFDGDSAGIKATYKAALLSLPLLNPKKFIQIILLPNELDPDSFLKKFSLNELVKILKKPISLIDFIFTESSKTLNIKNTDDKIIFDKYLDDITDIIKDKKIKYFYKKELKNLFFKKLREKNNINKEKNSIPKIGKLIEKQIFSYFASIINHVSVRKEILDLINNADFLEKKYLDVASFLYQKDIISLNYEIILENCKDLAIKEILEESKKKEIIQLFPYVHPKTDTKNVLKEIQDSVKNINTRLSNSKKINKSLNSFISESNSMNWEDLLKISHEIKEGQENI